MLCGFFTSVLSEIVHLVNSFKLRETRKMVSINLPCGVEVLMPVG